MSESYRNQKGPPVERWLQAPVKMWGSHRSSRPAQFGCALKALTRRPEIGPRGLEPTLRNSSLGYGQTESRGRLGKLRV
jgi:hypothetical protein